jgi:hypothetical protein
MCAYEPKLDMPALYRGFDSPVTMEDCGQMCAPHNPNGKPFCCDICRAVPVAYRQEWTYLSAATDLWHEWRGDECTAEPVDPADMRAETPDHLTLLACKGPAHCQRDYRATSCRQFPFFPYVTENYRFIGLAYYWDFEPYCWVLSHLDRVTETYRREFIGTFDEIFNLWPDEFESYAAMSEEAREYFGGRRRRIPLLHRNGGVYLISPGSERLTATSFDKLRLFSTYQA